MWYYVHYQHVNRFFQKVYFLFVFTDFKFMASEAHADVVPGMAHVIGSSWLVRRQASHTPPWMSCRRRFPASYTPCLKHNHSNTNCI